MSSLQVGQSLVGRRGSSYILQRILYEREDSKYKLWVTSDDKYVVKTVGSYQYTQAWQIEQELTHSRFIRKPVDGIDKHFALVFPYYTEDLLSFVRKGTASKKQIKAILQDALKGIRDLHSKHWVHGDIKPSNVMISWRSGVNGVLEILSSVVSDTEDAAKVREGECIDGAKLGNVYWRSPEANFGNIIDHKTDIFSFGSVVIYALSARVIFAYDTLKEGQTREHAVITNQISYFGDTITKGFVTRFDDPIPETIAEIFESFNNCGRKPFARLEIDGLDDNDRRFIQTIMKLDPAERPEAEDILKNPWWSI